MIIRPILALSLAAQVVLVASCAVMVPQRYAEIKATIPLQEANAIRVYIYRPHLLLGAAGRAVVMINGIPLANLSSPLRENMLLPGSVGVVDVVSDFARVTWVQDGRAEKTDAPLDIARVSAPTIYLRWSMKPTYGFLEQVPENQAAREISSLFFSGYGRIPTR